MIDEPLCISNKILVNPKFIKIFDTELGAFLGEAEMAVLEVQLSAFFLWALTQVGP